jgi:hypothetical protein
VFTTYVALFSISFLVVLKDGAHEEGIAINHRSLSLFLLFPVCSLSLQAGDLLVELLSLELKSERLECVRRKIDCGNLSQVAIVWGG